MDTSDSRSYGNYFEGYDFEGAKLNDDKKMKPSNKRAKKKNSEKSKLYRVINKVINSNPSVNIIDTSSDGDIRFEVKYADLGFSYSDIVDYRKEIFSDYMSNFIGEFLVRENVDIFYEIISPLKSGKYTNVVNRFQHKKFGSEIRGSSFMYIFHASLLESILVEDFKKEFKIFIG